MSDTPSARFTTLETGRLILRPLAEQDVDNVFHLYSDWDVSHYLSRITFPFTIEAAQHFVAQAQAALHQGSAYTLGIFQRVSGAFVGVISLRVPSLDPRPLLRSGAQKMLGLVFLAIPLFQPIGITGLPPKVLREW